MTPPPLHTPTARLAAAVAAFALLLVLPALQPWRTPLWGFHAWTFLDPASIALAATLSAGISLLLVRAPLGERAGWVVTGAAALLLFGGLRDTTHLLGDGRLWLAALRDAPAHHPHEPLAYAAARLATAGLSAAGETTGETAALAWRLEWFAVLLGLASLALGRRLTRELDLDPAGRRLAWALLLATGGTLFGFGYLEAYPALWPAVLFLLIEMTAWVNGRGNAARLGLSAGLVAAVHALGFSLFPAVALALHFRRPARRELLGLAGAAAVSLLVGYGLLPRLDPGAASGDDFGREWGRLLGELSFFPYGPAAWMLEQFNRWGASSGAAFLLVAAGLRGRMEGLRGRRAALFALAAAGLMAPAMLLNTEGSRGAAADWDAFVVAGAPLALLAATLWIDPAGRDRGRRRLLWLAAGLGLFNVIAPAMVNHHPGPAEARFRLLVTESFRTPRARSWGWETLAAWRRDENDMAGAAEAYDRALAEQPRNVRLLRNTAAATARLDQPRRTADILSRLVREEPGDPGSWLRLGLALEGAGSADSAAAALRQSVSLDPGSTETLNALAQLLLRRPEGRPEAWVLIDRSLRLSPGQRYAPELRAMRDRLAADGYAPR